jgi:ParB-like chromosome segregation protein Spo0J
MPDINDIVARAAALFAELDGLAEPVRMDAVNQIRLALHEHSPMKAEPVDCVLWVEADKVHSNDYNPNSVAPPEMRLLQLSIQADGYTQPIVAMAEADGHFEIVDGFHRHRVGVEVGAVRKRIKGRLPIAAINAERMSKEDRMASTIRHNRARGKHAVDTMADIVVDLFRRGWDSAKVAKELGMEADEVLRLRQITGIAAVFADREFSKAWD